MSGLKLLGNYEGWNIVNRNVQIEAPSIVGFDSKTLRSQRIFVGIVVDCDLLSHTSARQCLLDSIVAFLHYGVVYLERLRSKIVGVSLATEL